jgi:ketosteroid isomerase-like protein
MKQAVIFVGLALVGLNAFAGATPSETINAFHAAIAAGDKKTVNSLLSPEVIIYESGHVERSRDEYFGHHLGADMEFAKATKRTVVKHIEHVEGKTATVLQETETKGDFKGKPVKAIGVETAVLERIGDKWVIVHLHWSARK